MKIYELYKEALKEVTDKLNNPEIDYRDKQNLYQVEQIYLINKIKEIEQNNCKSCKEKPINENIIGGFCSKFCRSEYYCE